MTAPLQRGDLAEVIDGAQGRHSPNLGKHVTVGFQRGEHSKHGRIVRVHGANLMTDWGVQTDELDMAVIWLRKIEPPPLAPAARERVLEAA